MPWHRRDSSCHGRCILLLQCCKPVRQDFGVNGHRTVSAAATTEVQTRMWCGRWYAITHVRGLRTRGLWGAGSVDPGSSVREHCALS